MKEAKGSDLKPDGWWDTNPEYLTRLVQKGSADYLFEYLSTELLPSGIVLTARSIGKRKADRLSCSAIAWGVKECSIKAPISADSLTTMCCKA
ncbi:MAG: hypothetical protein E7A81_04130 [Clostridiales bacterium]|nr:hypothetical protein [Clostridiales bacterium]